QMLLLAASAAIMAGMSVDQAMSIQHEAYEGIESGGPLMSYNGYLQQFQGGGNPSFGTTFGSAAQQFGQSAAANQKSMIEINKVAIATNNQLVHMPTQQIQVGGGFSVVATAGSSVQSQVTQLNGGSTGYNVTVTPSQAAQSLQSQLQGLKS